jgi:glycosyltransferase involved in cell wall biosynthesis
VPKVSVVIPTFNYAQYVTYAVQSVLNQSVSDFEIILVDDGSTDNTQAVLAPFQPHIRYIYQDNRGLAAARNTGIRAAAGEYIAFLDSDDWWLPTKLERQVALLDRRDELGLVYCDFCWQYDETGTVVRSPQRGWFRSGFVFADLLVQNFIQTPTPIVRSQVFNAVGLFDESLPAREDWDMWLRIAARFEIAFVDEVLAIYRFHSRNMSRNYRLTYKCELQVFSKAVTSFPELTEQAGCHKNRRLAELELGLGKELWLAGECADARRRYWRAARANPWQIQPYIVGLMSFIPGAAGLLRLKRQLQRHRGR